MNNLHIFIIIIIIVLFIIYFIYLYDNNITNQFGKYDDIIIGQCVSTTGLCTDKGIRHNIQNCIPNPITGKGCILNNGTQSFDSLIYTESCNITCYSAVWQKISNNEVCIPPADPDNPNISPALTGQCLPRLSNTNTKYLGRKTLTYQCVQHDPTGPNNCTNVFLENIVGPTGVTGLLPLLKTYNIGDTIDIIENCDPIISNPICGNWTICNTNDNYIFSPNCVVSGGNITINLYKEGLLYNTSGCQLENSEVLVFNNSQPITHKCLQNPNNINCNTDNFTTDNVPQSIIDNPFVCSNTYNNSNISNNPVCVQLCRLYPTAQVSLSTNLDILINNPFIMFNNNNYLSGYQLPRTDNIQSILSNMYEPNNIFPSSNISLNNTGLLAINLGYKTNGNKPNCSDENLAFSTSIVSNLSFNSVINNNQITAKILMNIPPIFTGWLTTNSNNPQWTQLQNQYNGPGFNYSSAPIYTITVINPFVNQSVVGYPNSIGTMTIRISNLDNSSLNDIPHVNGGMINFFDTIDIIVFNYNTFSYSSRSITNNNSCSLYINTP